MPDSSLEHCHERDHIEVFGLTSISRVSRLLRDEFLSYLLNNVGFKTTLCWLQRYIATFGKMLFVCQGSLIILYSPTSMYTAVDLLPLLELATKSPALFVRFELLEDIDWQLPFDITLTEDLNNLLHACRSNEALANHIRHSVLRSIEFHSRTYLQHKYPYARLNTRIQINFRREYKQLWMDGTHSFDELQHFLSVTSLDSFTTLDMWVGVASMGARGKGLRTSAEVEELAPFLKRKWTTAE